MGGLAVAGCAMAWGVYVECVAPSAQAACSYERFAGEIRRRTQRPVIFFRVEAHEVAFHVGRPLDTILEWENLDHWASLPHVIYVIMPPECAACWRSHLRCGRLEEVLWSTSLGKCPDERPLVLMRSQPQAGKHVTSIVR
jgi:hypothetical protein